MTLTSITGIGEKTATALEKAGINSFTDLLENYPRTYRPYRATTVTGARVGDYVVLQGQLTKPISRRTARVTTELSTFHDVSGKLTLRWFNLPYITRSVSPSTIYQVKGKVEEWGGTKQIVSPELTKVEEEEENTNQLVPIYSQMGSLKPWIFRTKIKKALETSSLPPDPLPHEVIKKYSLLGYSAALHTIHNPSSVSKLEEAIHRLSFQELYSLQLTALRNKSKKGKLRDKLKVAPLKITQFISSLPFKLTGSQKSAINTILEDLESSSVMNRLLAGEVGSGKTVIAAVAALATHSAGKRVVIMAPTVILATQLHDAISSYLTPLNISVSLITASSKGDIKSDVLIGTQALLTKDLKNIGLTVIDEQHRFGVKQREKLAKLATHTLMMTATPIPRSLAQTIFSQLDITYLTELPASRLPVKTFAVSTFKRLDAYTWIKTQIRKGDQVFFVTPLIEQAEEADTTPLKSLRELESRLKKLFPNNVVDIMHGKMKDKEKLSHMADFRSGQTQILVATSMIEVGIDIPAANIIVIENADRFGLATLHQLRGRVGRGGGQGYCLLFSDSSTPKALERLKYFVRTKEGDKLALFDLQERGPGEIFGTTQSGFFRLKLASIYDEKLLKATHAAAKHTLKLAKSATST